MNTLTHMKGYRFHFFSGVELSYTRAHRLLIHVIIERWFNPRFNYLQYSFTYTSIKGQSKIESKVQSKIKSEVNQRSIRGSIKGWIKGSFTGQRSIKGSIKGKSTVNQRSIKGSVTYNSFTYTYTFTNIQYHLIAHTVTPKFQCCVGSYDRFHTKVFDPW